MRYLALLRGINVGGNNLIKMADLKACFEKAGFTNVSTYIQSGNVIFEDKVQDLEILETKLEQILAERFNYKATVLVRSAKQMSATVMSFPKIFHDDSWKHNVIFLGADLDRPDILNHFDPKPDIEEIHYSPGVIYWSANLDTITKSNMLKLATKKEYQKMTVRNQNTTRKLELLMNEAKG